jgi:hypothetical protein
MEVKMQFLSFTQSSSDSNRPTWPPRRSSNGYFDLHPIGAVLRSLFLSSLLWIFIAFTLYSVYTYVVAAK